MICHAYGLYHPALAIYRAPMPVHVYPVATLLSLVTYTSSYCMHVAYSLLLFDTKCL